MGITQHHTNTNIMWALLAAVAATTLVAWKFNQRIRAHVAMRKAFEVQEAASRPLDSAAVSIVRVLAMPADALMRLGRELQKLSEPVLSEDQLELARRWLCWGRHPWTQ